MRGIKAESSSAILCRLLFYLDFLQITIAHCRFPTLSLAERLISRLLKICDYVSILRLHLYKFRRGKGEFGGAEFRLAISERRRKSNARKLNRALTHLASRAKSINSRRKWSLRAYWASSVHPFLFFFLETKPRALRLPREDRSVSMFVSAGLSASGHKARTFPSKLSERSESLTGRRSERNE